jgi:hypothetical protein
MNRDGWPEYWTWLYVGLDTISDNSVLHLVTISVDRDQRRTWIVHINSVCCKIVWLLGSVMSSKETYYKVTVIVCRLHKLLFTCHKWTCSSKHSVLVEAESSRST